MEAAIFSKSKYCSRRIFLDIHFAQGKGTISIFVCINYPTETINISCKFHFVILKVKIKIYNLSRQTP